MHTYAHLFLSPIIAKVHYFQQQYTTQLPRHQLATKSLICLILNDSLLVDYYHGNKINKSQDTHSPVFYLLGLCMQVAFVKMLTSINLVQIFWLYIFKCIALPHVVLYNFYFGYFLWLSTSAKSSWPGKQPDLLELTAILGAALLTGWHWWRLAWCCFGKAYQFILFKLVMFACRRHFPLLHGRDSTSLVFANMIT